MGFGVFLMVVGGALMMGAWTFLRLPGQPFLTLGFPIWHSKRYMLPLGVKLTYTGLAVMYVGLGLCILFKMSTHA